MYNPTRTEKVALKQTCVIVVVAHEVAKVVSLLCFENVR